jgi:hypothetical protein
MTTTPAPEAAARPAIVPDKHKAELPRPTRREAGPLRVALDTDEERAFAIVEDYFNRRCQEGWALVDVGPLRWGFVACEPGEYVYRVATLEDPYYTPASQDYLDFLVSSGTEVVDIYANQFAFLRRPAALGPFEVAASRGAGRLAALRAGFVRMTGSLWAIIFMLFCCDIAFFGVLLRGKLGSAAAFGFDDFLPLWWVGFILVVCIGLAIATGRSMARINRRLGEAIAQAAVEG